MLQSHACLELPRSCVLCLLQVPAAETVKGVAETAQHVQNAVAEAVAPAPAAAAVKLPLLPAVAHAPQTAPAGEVAPFAAAAIFAERLANAALAPAPGEDGSLLLPARS